MSKESPYVFVQDTVLRVPPRKPPGTGSLTDKMSYDGMLFVQRPSGVCIGSPGMGYVSTEPDQYDHRDMHIMAVVDGHTDKRPSFSELTTAQQIDLAIFMHRHLFGSNDHTIICWNEGGDEHNALVGKNKIAKPSARSEGQFHMHAVTYRHAPEYRAISSETVDPKMLEPRRHAVADFFCEQLAAVFGNDIYLSQTRHGSIVFPLEVDEHSTPQYFRMLLQHIDNLMKTTWKRCCIDGPHKDIGARGESGNQVGHPKSYDEVDATTNALNIPYQTPTYSIAIQKDHDGGVFVAMQPHFFNHSGGMETLGHVITRISDQKCSPLSQEVIAERKVYAETLYDHRRGVPL